MVNKVFIIGNVGADPEVRTLESGIKTARLRVATTERTFNKEKNESVDHTEWHTISLWRGLADVADRYIHKGTQVFIEGRLRTREWSDKEGKKQYTTEVLADNIKLLGGKTERQERPVVQPAPQPQSVAEYGNIPSAADDGLPF
jgi:single-strand DNA-binding protein